MNLVAAARMFLLGMVLFPLGWPIQSLAIAATNYNLRIMAANLNGNTQSYQPFALRLFQGLKPDVVAIQEFNYGNNTPADFRAMLDTAFGTNFVYSREPNGAYSIPNGIISRYPIVASGSWDDPSVGDRGFAWAQIRLPGTNDLYVVSVHLYSSGSASDRNTEASAIKDLVLANFPLNSWVVVAGDFNTSTRTEAAVSTFKTFLSDSPIPTDAESGGDPDTNEPRSKPYDYVLPSFSLAAFQTNTVFASHCFSNGLVFDSRVYAPLSDVSPVLVTDSGTAQHMAVLKDFHVVSGATNSPGTTGPAIVQQPQSQTATPGGSVGLSVTCTGTAPLAYQWFFNGGALAAHTSNSFSITNVQTSDAGDYFVVVTNSYGKATSSVATLALRVPPSGIIAQWTFNSVPPDGTTTTGTTAPEFGTGIASLIGGTSAAFANGVSGAGDDSGWNTTGYPAQGTSNKLAGVQFAVSTAGKRNILIRWHQKESNTGSKYVRLQYSTNGTSFTDYPVSISVSGTSFEPKTNDLSAFAGANDNPRFAFRLVAEFENAATGYVAASPTSSYGTGGTIRYDMVTVLGESVPSPVGLSMPQAGVLQWEGPTNTIYTVQACDDLAQPNWANVATMSSPFRTLWRYTNSPAGSQRFYRVFSQ